MNRVILIGRLTRDPELNFLAGSGMAVCRFTLAVKRPFKKDETDFPNCIAFGKRAEAISQYVTKGNQLAVVGYLRTGSYDTKDGSKRYTNDVIVDNFEFIETNKNRNSENNKNQDNFYDGMEPDDSGDMPF